jgi:glycosyltransferase involved in cell wall biosynthesis
LETPETPSTGAGSGTAAAGGDGRPSVALILHKFSRGGSDRVAAYLARGFVDAGLGVEMIVFCRGGEVETVLTEIVGADIPICYLGRSTGLRPLDLVLGLPAAVRELRRMAPDVAVSTANNTALTSWAALVLAGLGRCRLVLKTTNPVARSRHRGLGRMIRRWSYRQVFRRTSAVWTLSAEESAEVRAEYPDAAAVVEDVYNPYVTPQMLAAPAAGEIAHDPTLVVTVARLTAQKRLDRLIAAFARVRTPGARLLILGEGELRATLEAQVRDAGLDGRVSMPGYARNVAEVLHRAHAFVLTSDYEGLPAALLEAMAADCAVLSTDSFPAARSLLQAEGATLIGDPGPEALGALIDAALARPRPAGLRAVAERYSIRNGVASHLAALRRLL